MVWRRPPGVPAATVCFLPGMCVLMMMTPGRVVAFPVTTTQPKPIIPLMWLAFPADSFFFFLGGGRTLMGVVAFVSGAFEVCIPGCLARILGSCELLSGLLYSIF